MKAKFSKMGYIDSFCDIQLLLILIFSFILIVPCSVPFPVFICSCFNKDYTKKWFNISNFLYTYDQKSNEKNIIQWHFHV